MQNSDESVSFQARVAVLLKTHSAQLITCTVADSGQDKILILILQNRVASFVTPRDCCACRRIYPIGAIALRRLCPLHRHNSLSSRAGAYSYVYYAIYILHRQ